MIYLRDFCTAFCDFVPHFWRLYHICTTFFLLKSLIMNTVPTCTTFFFTILKKKKIIYIYREKYSGDKSAKKCGTCGTMFKH